MYTALVRAGFRRFATYRQATFAGAVTNVVFGYLRCYVMLATVAASSGVIAGYREAQLVTYVWVGQGLLATVDLLGGFEHAERIRTGEVITDLLRPVDVVWQLLAVDLGRMCYALLSRFAVPVVVGVAAFDFYLPRHWPAYPAFVASVLVATVICFGCKHVAFASVYWLMDLRGPRMFWALVCGSLSGLLFPMWFLPHWLALVLVYGTPFPSVVQTPTDILTERRAALPALAAQLAWLVAILASAQWVQRRANRRLVIQGG